MQHPIRLTPSVETPLDDSGELDLYSIKYVLSAGSKKPQHELALQRIRYHVTQVVDQVSPGPPSYDDLPKDEVFDDQIPKVEK
jgi:hypothetical protein